MDESDVVLGLVHRTDALEEAISELSRSDLHSPHAAGLQPKLQNLHLARQQPIRKEFLARVPYASQFRAEMQSAATESILTSTQGAYEEMLQKGTIPGGTFGQMVKVGAKALSQDTPMGLNVYLSAKADLVRAIRGISELLIPNPPLIVHTLFFSGFGRLCANYSTSVDVLVGGVVRGHSNIQFAHPVGTYTVSLQASGYTPQFHPACIQPNCLCIVTFV